MAQYEEICLLKKIAEYFKDINKHPLAEIIGAEFRKEVQNFPNFKEPEYVNENLKSIFNKHIKLKKRMSDARERKSFQKSNADGTRNSKSVLKKKSNSDIENDLEPQMIANIVKESAILNETNMNSLSTSESTNYANPLTSTPLGNNNNYIFPKPDQSSIHFESNKMDSDDDDGMEFEADESIVPVDTGDDGTKSLYNAKTLRIDDCIESLDYYEHKFVKPSQSIASSVHHETSSINDIEGNSDVAEDINEESIVRNGDKSNHANDNNVDEEMNNIVEKNKIDTTVEVIQVTAPIKQGCEIATQCDEDDITQATQPQNFNIRKRSHEEMDGNVVNEHLLNNVDLDNDTEDLFATQNDDDVKNNFVSSQKSPITEAEIVPPKRTRKSSLSSLESLPEEVAVKSVKSKTSTRSNFKAVLTFKDNKKLDMEKRILLSDGWILWPKSLLSGCLKHYNVSDFKEALDGSGVNTDTLETRIDLITCCLTQMSTDKLIVQVYHESKKVYFYMKLSCLSANILELYEIDVKTYEDCLWYKSFGPKGARRLCAEASPENVNSLLGVEVSFVKGLLEQNNNDGNKSEEDTEE